jgi:oligopeptide/dipeptide ABC transporter ATP-binding protein
VSNAAMATDGAAVSGSELLVVEDLKKHFPVTRGIVFQKEVASVKAVDGVSFTVRSGETLGVVGESGCGKSTMARCVMRLLEPTGGKVVFDGRDITKLSRSDMRPIRRELMMIFQDPYASLNARKRVGFIIAEALEVHKMGTAAEIKRRVQELLEVVGLNPEHYNRFPHEFSGGQRQRIGIARALALRPKLIIADEPVSALDVSIQAQIINLLEQLQEEFDLTYLFIAHDLAVVRHISDRIVVMYLGWIVEVSPAAELYEKPLHPYTISLLSAVPIPDPVVERQRESILLSGDLPSPANPPPACRFHTRCPFIQPTRCRDEIPPLRPLSNGHEVACHWAEEILAGQIKPREREPVIVAPLPESVEEPPPV